MVTRVYTTSRGIQIPIEEDEEIIDLDTINADTYERYVSRQKVLMQEKQNKETEKQLQILKNQQANVILAENRFRQMIKVGEERASVTRLRAQSIGGRGNIVSNLASVVRNTGMFGSTISQGAIRGAAAQALNSVVHSSGSGAAESAMKGYSAPGGAQESSALYAAPGISIIPVSEGTQGYTTVQTPEGPAVLGEGWAKGSQYMNTQNAYLYSGNSYSFIDASTVSHGTVSGPSVEYASGNLSGVMADSP